MNLKNSPTCNARPILSAVNFGERIFMKTFRLRRDSALCCAVSGLLVFGFAANVQANPNGMSVARGIVSASQNGSQLTVNASANAFINWKSFNIAAGETTTFVQPSS